MSDLILLLTVMRDAALAFLVVFALGGLIAFGMLWATYKQNGWKP